MNANNYLQKLNALNNWFKIPQGIRVARAFSDELVQIKDQLYGRHLIQLGNCDDNIWLKCLNFDRKWVVHPTSQPQVALKADFCDLPIERDSVDCVVAPLTLESCSYKKDLIDEIDRILKPLGHAIFFGINPFSFWGAASSLKRLDCFNHLPIKMMSSINVKRNMIARGYRQSALTSFYYIPPVKSEPLIKTLAFLNEMGKMVWPFPAGFYCLIVQKYQYCPPPLKVRADLREEIDEKSMLPISVP